MNKHLLMLASASAVVAAAPAQAAIIITTSPVTTTENVQFKDAIYSATNQTFTTDTNKGTNITFVGNEVLKTPSSGAARVTGSGTNDGLTYLEFYATDPTIGFNAVEFYLNASKKLASPIATLTFYDNLGGSETLTTGALGNGENRFAAYSDVVGQAITRIEIQLSSDILDVRQIRLDPTILSNAVAVPEPSTWMMMILGVGLTGGAMRRSRQRQTVRFDMA